MGLFLVWLIAWAVNGLIWGLISDYVAKSKGYDSGFAWGFWLGLIGLLVVGFRPNIQQHEEYRPMYPEAIDAKKTWTCGCGSKNPEAITYCLSCRRAKGSYEPLPPVKCPHCGANNSATNTVCFACNKSLTETPKAAYAIEPKTNYSNMPENKADIKSEFGKSLELLAQLSKLHEAGILNDDEFSKKKSEVLDRM